MSWGIGQDIPDHPVIRNMERTGYPDGREPDRPRCPNCGNDEPGEIFELQDGSFRCDACIRTISADDLPEDAVCPVCGKPFEYLYREPGGSDAGCDMCAKSKDPYDVEECFPPREDPWQDY